MQAQPGREGNRSDPLGELKSGEAPRAELKQAVELRAKTLLDAVRPLVTEPVRRAIEASQQASMKAAVTSTEVDVFAAVFAKRAVQLLLDLLGSHPHLEPKITLDRSDTITRALAEAARTAAKHREPVVPVDLSDLPIVKEAVGGATADQRVILSSIRDTLIGNVPLDQARNPYPLERVLVQLVTEPGKLAETLRDRLTDLAG